MPAEISLTELKPGETFTTDIKDINPQFNFKIERPGAFVVIEY